MILLCSLFALPAFSQTPTVTGTWTGTTNINGDLGLVSQDFTFIVTSQTGNDFVCTLALDSELDGPTTLYGRVDSLLSLWQMHGAGVSAYGQPLRIQGYYTPAVPLLSPAKITLDGEYSFPYYPGYPQIYDTPAVFHVVLTQ